VINAEKEEDSFVGIQIEEGVIVIDLRSVNQIITGAKERIKEILQGTRGAPPQKVIEITDRIRNMNKKFTEYVLSRNN